MNIDIVFVTYNSEKWIDGCINSILKNKYDLSKISLIFYDNNSKDNTLKKLEEIKSKNKKIFKDFIVVKSNKNKGFGYGNNIGARYGNSPYIFFLNVDTEINEDTFSKLENAIKNSDEKFAMWELAQRPYEHPKFYNPITGETSWASGACMIVKRNVYEKLGGFDTKIFMYCEDVEISWNFRKNGYAIKYLFDIPIIHYSYEKPNEFKYTQFVYGFISNWYIRAKYGQFKNFMRGTQYMFQTAFKGTSIPKSLDKNTIKKIKSSLRYEIFKHFFRNLFINIFTEKMCFEPRFIFGLDYEISNENPFYIQPDIKSNPLVSIIVRTCDRKEALRENLISLRNQTYKNIEIIVIEDGENISEQMVKREFSDLNILYEATGKNVGRSKAANIAMSKATGKYLNFLDDDDIFFPNHVETLVKVIENNNYDIVYDGAFETKINVISKKPYKYEVKAKGLCESKKYSKKRLYRVNLFPIQTVMFKRDLFIECGGFDENIDALEDWDFWVRLSLKHEFHQVLATTSIFRTPYDKTIEKERDKFLLSTLNYLNDKFKTYKPELSVSDFYIDDKY